ncbi:MAG: hypothetical protein HQ478_07515 [Chloroflexi bacterium]|nr:hypothetical protein [Chloroflexota bacterium]
MKTKLTTLLISSLLILVLAACGTESVGSTADTVAAPVDNPTAIVVDDHDADEAAHSDDADDHDAEEAAHDDGDDHDAEEMVMEDHDQDSHDDMIGEGHGDEDSEATGHAHGEAVVDPDAPVVHFFAKEFQYTTETTEVEVGHGFTIMLHNEGVLEHDVTFEGLEAQGGIHLQPGEDAMATFVIDEPGTYTYYCTVPGHKEAGMRQTLEVVAGDHDDHDAAG